MGGTAQVVLWPLTHAMVGEYVLSNAHNCNLTLEFTIYFYHFYFTSQEASVAPRVFATRQVIQIDGLTSSFSPNNMAKGARAIIIFLSFQHARGSHLNGKPSDDILHFAH